MSRLFPGFMFDFTESLDMIGNKSNWDNQDIPDLLQSKPLDGVVQGRLEPFARPHFTLVAKLWGHCHHPH